MISEPKTQATDCTVWKGALMECDPFYTCPYDEEMDDNNRYEREKAYEEREAWLRSPSVLRFL